MSTAAPLDEATETRDDILLLLRSGRTATRHDGFYGRAGESRLSMDFLHAYMGTVHRRRYARCLSAGLTDHVALGIVFQLLRTKAAVTPEARTEEGGLNQAIVRLQRRAPEAAVPLLLRVVEHYRHVGQKPLLAIACAARAEAAVQLDAPAEALRWLGEATTLVPGFVDVDLAGIYDRIARATSAHPDLERAALLAAIDQWTALGRDAERHRCQERLATR